MTHPIRINPGKLTVTDAMRRITDAEMTKMCLAVNQLFGTAYANKLLDLFGAARQQMRAEDEAAE